MLHELLAEAQAFAPLETGGCVAGYYTPDTGDAVITHSIGPGPEAEHFGRKFVPDRNYHDQRLQELWEASGGTLRYMGDWHSHPGGSSELSSLDRAFMKHALGSPEAYLRYGLVALVYGDLHAVRWWILGHRRGILSRSASFHSVKSAQY